MALIVYHRDGAISAPLSAGSRIIVGREPPADIPVGDPSLSRLHARFALEGDQVLVEDLDSTNGTTLRGEPVRRALLAPGAEVQLGRVTVAVHSLTGGGTPANGEALLSHDAFGQALAAEIARARHFGRSTALLLVGALERTAEGVRAFWPALRERLAPVDVAGLYAPDVLELLLLEATPEMAADRARDLLATPGVPPLRVGVATFPECGASVDALLEPARAALLIATAAAPVQVAPPAITRTVTREPAGAPRPVLVSEAMRGVARLAERLGRATLPVLIEGETGTGKELVARLVHAASPRADKPLLCVNCAAIPRDLVEATLFGHEKGAFTGAVQRRLGVFEAAAGSTVLLDEIGELPPSAQAALLRVLETKRFHRVGSTDEIEVDVRVLAATHRDLESMVPSGAFREDLLFRINGMSLSIPPLRERSEDIRPLADLFLREAVAESGARVDGIGDRAMAVLEAHAWPGNVRELRNVIARAVVLAEGTSIGVGDLPPRLWRNAAPRPVASAAPPGAVAAPAAENPVEADPTAADPEQGFRARMERFEAGLLRATLEACAWNLPEAARRLEMPLRTLQHKVASLGLRG